MRFNICEDIKAVTQSPVIGNVYNVRGGTGARNGHMMVLVSIVGTTVTTLTVNKNGDIVSGSNYGLHYFEDKCPIAYVDGLEELNFNIARI
jgi:hypothetical protein